VHGHNDGGLGRDLVWDVDVHVDLGGIGTKVVHLLQLRRERHLRGQEAEYRIEQHCCRLGGSCLQLPGAWACEGASIYTDSCALLFPHLNRHPISVSMVGSAVGGSGNI